MRGVFVTRVTALAQNNTKWSWTQESRLIDVAQNSLQY